MAKVVVMRACPPASGTVPNGVPLSENCTLPVGLPAGPLPATAAAVTVAVKVTGWPTVAGFWLAAMVKEGGRRGGIGDGYRQRPRTQGGVGIAAIVGDQGGGPRRLE